MFPALILSFATTAPMLDAVVQISLRDDIPLLQIVREARKTELNIDKIQNPGEEEVALTFPHMSEGQRSYPHADCPLRGSFAQGTPRVRRNV